MKRYILPLVLIATACSETENTEDFATSKMMSDSEQEQVNYSISDSANISDSIVGDSTTSIISEIDSVSKITIDVELKLDEQDRDEVLKTTPPKEDKEVAEVVDLSPQENARFPGGSPKLAEYYRKNFVYPERAKEIGLEGKVYVQFTVNPDGSISNIHALKKYDKLLDDAAIDFIKRMPKWVPAQRDGKLVSDKVTLPVDFRLK